MEATFQTIQFLQIIKFYYLSPMETGANETA